MPKQGRMKKQKKRDLNEPIKSLRFVYRHNGCA